MKYNDCRGTYEELSRDRDPYVDRAQEVANLTLPLLFPPDGYNNTTDMDRAYQSLGARGVASLSSKMLTALFPIRESNFKLEVAQFELDKIEAEQGSQDSITELNAVLGKIEIEVQKEIDSRGYRALLHEALKQLLIAGNVLVNLTSKGKLKVHRLDSYVVKRNSEGDPVLIVLKEMILPDMLPKDVQAAAAMENQERGLDRDNEVDIYTKLWKEEDGSWSVYQESGGVILPGSQGSFATLPYLPLRLEATTGSDYGYGYVTQLLGDLYSYEHLTQAMVQAAAALSKVVFLVAKNANGTDAEELASCENGAVLTGRAEDVTVVQAGGKNADLSIAFNASQGIKDRLEAAFMMNSSVQRNAERVTATEISAMVEELEMVLAGSYAVLANEFQGPFIRLVLNRLQSIGRIPELPEDLVLPTITTGINALGRGAEINRLDNFIGAANSVLGPAALQYVNITEYLNRRLTALGLPNEGLLKSKEQIQQEQQAAQQAALAQQVAPQVTEAGLAEEQPQQQ